MQNFTSKFEAVAEILILGPRPFLAFLAQHHHQNFMHITMVFIITVDSLEELCYNFQCGCFLG